MNVLSLGAIIALLTLVFGAGLAGLFVWLSNLVVANAATIEDIEREKKTVNPAATGGYAIQSTASLDEQLIDARKIAARRAAMMPRGANVGIGRLATTDARKNKKVTTTGIENDPLSAVRIARFHTWQGLQYQGPTKLAAVPVARGATKQVKRKLVAGKDYPVVEITAAMSPQERRTARIANAKAKSAAYKALKEAGLDMVAETVVVEAPAAVDAVAATAPAPTSAAAPPPPEMIELTDGMTPQEKRSARIANTKAKSAYKKQLKALGIDPKSVKI